MASYNCLVAISLVALLVAAPLASAQQQTPPARAPAPNGARPPPPPTGNTATQTPPATTTNAARAPAPMATTANNGGNAANTNTANTARAPAPMANTGNTGNTNTANTARAPAPTANTGNTGNTANTARAPAPMANTGNTANTARAPAPMTNTATTANRPTMAPIMGTTATTAMTPGTRMAPAPGPAGGDTLNTTITFPSQGALDANQQMQLCQAVTGTLSTDFPSVNQCTVSSQMASQQPSFSTTGRRLSQANINLSVTLSLARANAAQLPGIQTALARLALNIGGTRAPITIINIVVIQVTFVATTAPMPTGTPALPPTTTIMPATGAPGPMPSVTTAVPANATANTTMNVPMSQAIPATPMGGTSTTTTTTNSTTTTTITTTAVFSVTLQVTIIQQYFFTFLIGQTVGVLTIVDFNLGGNVVNNVPLVITGGVATGQTATFRVTGATVTTIQTQMITTATQTTQTTTTTQTNQMTTTTNTGTTTTTTTTTPVVRNVCSVPNNPYGLIQNTATEGTLVKGAFLVSVWNDANNQAGNGNIIYQCMPNGQVTRWATVSVSGACTRDGNTVGLTGALSRCGSVIIVGSLPIPAAGPRPGCLIALDTSGNKINEVVSPGINGPWGSVCTSSNGNITLALSSVLGGTAPAVASGGRRLQQAPAPAPGGGTGFVVRWTFPTPTSSTWTLGPPTFLVRDIMTGGAAGVANGAVGPGLLTADDQGSIYAPDLMGNQILRVPNGFTTSTTGGTPVTTSVALSAPNSVFFYNGQLLGTNTGNGNLFTITLNGGATTLTTVVPATAPMNGGGVNFNAIVSTDSAAGAPIGSYWFHNDANNTLNTIGAAPPGLAPTMSATGMTPAGGPMRAMTPTSG